MNNPSSINSGAFIDPCQCNDPHCSVHPQWPSSINAPHGFNRAGSYPGNLPSIPAHSTSLSSINAPHLPYYINHAANINPANGASSADAVPLHPRAPTRTLAAAIQAHSATNNAPLNAPRPGSAPGNTATLSRKTQQAAAPRSAQHPVRHEAAVPAASSPQPIPRAASRGDSPS